MTLVEMASRWTRVCTWPLRRQITLVEMATFADALVRDRKEADRKALSRGLRPFSKRLCKHLSSRQQAPSKNQQAPPERCENTLQNL